MACKKPSVWLKIAAVVVVIGLTKNKPTADIYIDPLYTNDMACESKYLLVGRMDLISAYL